MSDELDFAHTPDFVPLDIEAREEMGQVVYTELTALMYAAHAEEATTMEVQSPETAECVEEERIAAA
jgi:hypothetical protein